jgi:hypothetical protein
MNLNSASQDNESGQKKNSYYYQPKKSHWKKYQLYYLVFGSFFVTIVIILIGNSNINKQIRKINERLARKTYSSDFSFDLDSSSKMTNYMARLKNEPFPDYVKERVKNEIAKIERDSFGGQTKESREE